MELKIVVLLLSILFGLSLVSAGTVNMQCPPELQEMDRTGYIPIEIYGQLSQSYEIEVKCPPEIEVESTFLTRSQDTNKLSYKITKPDEIYTCTAYLYLKNTRILQSSCKIDMIWRENTESISIIEPTIQYTILDNFLNWLRSLFS